MQSVEKVVQEVQANTGARIDSMTQQAQGVSDNVQDIQARVAKLAQQLNDVQSTLQSIDAKVSGGSVAPPPSSAPTGASNAAPPPDAAGSAPAPGSADSSTAGSSLSSPAADTLYQNALRDYTSGKYDLSQQEFSDYIQNFPTNDLASNSQFYLGEIAFSQNDFRGAIKAYDVVLDTYPKSFKLAASIMKRGMAELELGQKASGIRDLREVIRRFPGSDEARRAQAKLREIGAPAAPRAPAR
jgi:tol-pal system protein YbgF